MEDARTDLFALFNPSLALPKWNLIVAGTRCDFLAQVTFAEWLTVFTWISKIGNSSFVVEHALQNDRGEYVARGQATLIYYNYERGKAESIPEQVRGELNQHSEGPADAPALRA